ncbi:hypothetical protein NE237_027549 [Protea cynaroides]|uniref:Tyrosine decarboxylase n=1 Tax=Protea cynaroides TaxID=273540 RepID=A0A9Q0JT99_9MAGN|nr:hypothetical protein NE237_027549 [Protea cynaroides]
MGTLPVEIFNPLDLESFIKESHMVLDLIANYYKDVEKYPVQSKVDPGFLWKHSPTVAPYLSEPLEEILDDVHNIIIPGLTHWQSPNFFAYFQANASTAGFLGEMLCTGLNVVGFNWITSPAATELERIVMDWMGKLLKLPRSFLFSGKGGDVLHGSSCESIVCTLAAARDKVLKEMGGHMNITKLVVYGSDQTHSCLQKAAKLVGIPPSNFRPITTSSSMGFSLSAHDVRVAMEEDLASGLVPMILCGTVGTTGSGAVDQLDGLGHVAKEFGVWFHIDAAYAGSACICPEFRHYLDGVELADSISMNPHKWFLSNMDCCCLWVKNPKLLVDSLSSDPEYLRNKFSDQSNDHEVVDYKDWQIALSRRFHAIKLWIVLRRYGEANLMSHIRSDMKLAKHFESLVVADGRFEVVVPRRFAVLCFRLKLIKGEDGCEMNRNLLDAINSSGRAYMTHTVLRGIFIIRCAIGTTLTEQRRMLMEYGS